jgi:ATP-dependent DNA helicase PIF1
MQKRQKVNDLDEDQRRVFQRACEGSNLFFTGPAGTGKSFLLQYVIDELVHEQKKNVYVTSSTGVSALNIGGRPSIISRRGHRAFGVLAS